MDPLIEIKLKQAFSKVREDIYSLKKELNEYKALIRQLIDKVSPHYETQKPLKTNDFSSSTGNEGVYSFSQSFIHSPFTHLNTKTPLKSTKPSNLILTSNNLPPQDNLKHPLQTLTNKEFLVFFSIYQLEKELQKVTYNDIANKLSLTPGCIRSYITSLIRKKAPIIKSKINNKIITLSIDKTFSSLTSEKKLIDLYYQNDSHQSTLSQ